MVVEVVPNSLQGSPSCWWHSHCHSTPLSFSPSKKEAQRGGQSGGIGQRIKQSTSERTNQVRWSSEPALNSEKGAGESLWYPDGQGLPVVSLG